MRLRHVGFFLCGISLILALFGVNVTVRMVGWYALPFMFFVWCAGMAKHDAKRREAKKERKGY